MAFAPLASDVMLAVYTNGAVARTRTSPTCGSEIRRVGHLDEHLGRHRRRHRRRVFERRHHQPERLGARVPVNASDDLRLPQERSRCREGVSVRATAPAGRGRRWLRNRRHLAAGRRSSPAPACSARPTARRIWLFSVVSRLRPIRFCSPDSTGRRGRHGPRFRVPAAARSPRLHFGSPRVGNNQVGLIWTEGTTNFDVVTASLNTDTTTPTVSMTASADGAIINRGRPSPCRRPPRMTSASSACNSSWTAPTLAPRTPPALHDDVERGRHNQWHPYADGHRARRGEQHDDPPPP